MAIIMTIEQAINILETHNKWRRGDDNIEMTDPEILGIAIDLVIKQYNSLLLIDQMLDKLIKSNKDYEDHMDRGILEDAISDADEKFEHRHLWDVTRIQLLCYNRGYLVSLEDCAMLWETYSDRYTAGWLQLDETDDEVFEHIKSVDLLEFDCKYFKK